MSSFYRREVLKRALEIIWRRKILLFIGFFAGLFTHGGEPDLLFRDFNSMTKIQSYIASIKQAIDNNELQTFLFRLKLFVTDNPGTTVLYILVTLILAAVLLWLIMVSQAALIRITAKSLEKKDTGLFDGLATGAERFWPMVWINVVTKLFTWALWVILAGTPAIVYLIHGGFGWKVAAAVASIAVTLPLSIIVSFITKYAASYTILENTSAQESVRRAWKLFKENWLVSVEISILIYLISLAFNYVILGVTLLTIQPFSWFGLNSILVILAIIHAVISAFSYIVWTIVFTKLVAGKADSKIERVTTKLVNLAGPKRITG